MATELFDVTLTWTGNDGTGTSTGRFSREGELAAERRPTIPTSSRPARPDAVHGWTPEDLLAGSVAECHMLWFLHLCSRNAITVESYVDNATATLETEGSHGSVTLVELRATVDISAGDIELTRTLFDKAGELCYIANSLNCPVHHEITVRGAFDA